MEETRTYKTEVVVPCRVSYVRIDKPYVGVNGTEKYSLTCIIDKEDAATLDKIRLALDEAFAKGLATKWNDSAPDDPCSPLKDGDELRPNDEAYKGKYFISASNSKRPEIVDRNVEEIKDRSRVYSGCYCNVVLDMYPFKNSTMAGVAAELGAIQLVREGEELSARKSLKSKFSVIE